MARVSAEGFEDLTGGVEAGGAGEADSGMSAGAAEEESADGRLIAGEAEERAHGEKLVEREFAVGNVAAGEAVVGFEVERSDDAASEDFGGKVGRIFGEGVNDCVGEGVFLRRPIGVLQFIRGVLYVDGHDVFACGREGRIKERRNGGFEIGRSGEFAVFGGVEGAFEIIDFGADVDAGGEGVNALGFGEILERGECGKRVESEMDAGDDPAGAIVAHLLEKTGREMHGFDEMEESALGVGAGDDGFGGDFFAIGKRDAGDGAIFDEDAGDFGVGANFGAGLAGGSGEGIRNSSSPTAM